MKKWEILLVFSILIVGLIGFVIAEDITCSVDGDCGEITSTSFCSNDTYLCTESTTPTCLNAGTNESYCDNVTSTECLECEFGCENNSCNINDTNQTQTNETEPPGCPELGREECEADDRCGWDESKNMCRNRNALQKGKVKPLKSWVSEYLGSDECPEGCTCAGSVIKCDTESGRVMTVVAGKSGNIIIQTKNINASTTINLINNASGFYANTSRGLKKVKYMPDQVKERALERLRIRNCGEENNCSIELKEVGKQLAYEIQAERHAKLLGMFRKKMQVKAQVDAETGELIKVKKAWWAFLASEPEE